MLEEKKYYSLKLAWKFGNKGMPTALVDPIDKKRKIRLMKLEAFFQWHNADTRRVVFQMELRGATGIMKGQSKEVYEIYDFIHQLFFNGITECGICRGTAIVSPSFAVKSDTSWIDAAYDGLCHAKTTLGVTAKFHEPRLYGNSQQVIKALFR